MADAACLLRASTPERIRCFELFVENERREKTEREKAVKDAAFRAIERKRRLIAEARDQETGTPPEKRKNEELSNKVPYIPVTTIDVIDGTYSSVERHRIFASLSPPLVTPQIPPSSPPTLTKEIASLGTDSPGSHIHSLPTSPPSLPTSSLIPSSLLPLLVQAQLLTVAPGTTHELSGFVQSSFSSPSSVSLSSENSLLVSSPSTSFPNTIFDPLVVPAFAALSPASLSTLSMLPLNARSSP